MKHIMVFVFLFLFVSCKDKNCIKSTSYDKRCRKIQYEAYKQGRESGVCYKVPEGEAILSSDSKKLDPDHEACNALYDEADKKCKALPPPGPDDIVYTSGSVFGRKSECD